MTPLTEASSARLSLGGMSQENQSSVDTVVMDTSSSFVDSPPRSHHSKSHSPSSSGNNRSLLFNPTLRSEGQEQVPIGPSLTPSAQHRHHSSTRRIASAVKAAGTPKSRRLFEDDDNMSMATSTGTPYRLNGHRRVANQQQRSRLLHPLDLNHEDPTNSLDSTDMSIVSQAPRSRSRYNSHHSNDGGPADPPTSRKRTSTERTRQEISSPRTPYSHANNCLFPTAPDSTASSSASAMHTSPHLSPNSFLTMDGRFVHSNNPFSSPLALDEDNLTPRLSEYNKPQPPAMYSPARRAPTFPVCFDEDDDDEDDASANATTTITKMRGILPRRNSNAGRPELQPHPSTATATTAPAPALTNGGYPDRRFSFTGSPIAEHAHGSTSPDVAMDTTTTTSTNAAATRDPIDPATRAVNSMIMASTDMAQSSADGSLHKVRKFGKNDDIVASSRLSYQYQRPHQFLDTNNLGPTASSAAALYGGLRGKKNDMIDLDDDISPTEVQSFPFEVSVATGAALPPPVPPPVLLGTQNKTAAAAPPTPMKPRRSPPPPLPYARIQRQEPVTPARTRQQERTRAARTPHPPLHHHPRHPAAAAAAGADHASAAMMDHEHDHPVVAATGAVAAAPKSRFYDDYDVIAELGKGGFGKVYKVLSRLDGFLYAIKVTGKAKGKSDRNRMLKEVYALAALSDQADTATFHIVRYHQAWMEDDRLHIQTELCTGTVRDENNQGRLPEPRRYKLLREMLLALEFIHRNNMVHLDIKPDNIFVKNDQYKLGDWGLVTKASALKDAEEGDSRYMSLELLSGDSTDLTKSDLFSLGITMYELCRGQPLPMNGDEWQNLRAGRLVSPLPETSPELFNLIQQMMNSVAELRPTASDLLKHPQLLSDEQKALIKERTKVATAKLQLAAQQAKFLAKPPRKGLVRANTWNGTSMNPYL